MSFSNPSRLCVRPPGDQGDGRGLPSARSNGLPRGAAPADVGLLGEGASRQAHLWPDTQHAGQTHTQSWHPAAHRCWQVCVRELVSVEVASSIILNWWHRQPVCLSALTELQAPWWSRALALRCVCQWCPRCVCPSGLCVRGCSPLAWRGTWTPWRRQDTAAWKASWLSRTSKCGLGWFVCLAGVRRSQCWRISRILEPLTC